MTSLIDIPSVRIEHLPTVTSDPVTLANGTLSLSLIPPSATHPAETLALTVGTTSFPLSPSSPVHKVHPAAARHSHSTYVFSPSAGAGNLIGQVRISIKESCVPFLPLTDMTANCRSSEGEYQAVESLCRVFETTLTNHQVLDKSVLGSDTRGLTVHNWGDSAASAVINVAESLASKITAFSDA
jgi:hypothetical protein